MGGALTSPRIDHQTLYERSYRDYRSRIMPATNAAAAAKKTLSSATCDTTETIRACMHYLRRRMTGRDRLFHSHLSETPGHVAVLCIDLLHTFGFGKTTKQLKS